MVETLALSEGDDISIIFTAQMNVLRGPSPLFAGCPLVILLQRLADVLRLALALFGRSFGVDRDRHLLQV